MATTTANKNIKNVCAHMSGKPLAAMAIAAGAFAVSPCILASDWDVTPSIKVATTYSDNIDRNVSADSDVALEITPSINVVRDSRRLQMSLDYSLQNLFYFDESDRNATNHRLFSDLTGEVVDETLFIDLSASIRQQLVDRKSDASGDTISGGSNVSDVYTYSISPYWREQLGNILEWDLRLTHDSVNTEDSGNDSEGNGVSLSVVNGTATGRFSWDVNYDNREVDYDDGDKSDTETANARINYRLTRSLSAVLSGTYEDFEFVGDRGNTSPEDSTVGGGFTWAPSDDFSTTILYNDRLDPQPGEDNSFVSADIYWAPTARTDINLSYGNRFFGETYNGSLTHTSRWTRWNLSYSEGVSDFRSLELELNPYACPFGAEVLAECRVLLPGEVPQPGEYVPTDRAQLNTSISEDTFINKRAIVSVALVGARNTITLTGTNARRTFVADNESEKDTVIDLAWDHQIAPRTDSTVAITDSSLEFDDGQEDDIMRYRWRVTQQIGGSSIFYVEAQYYDRESNVASRNYDETRFTVSFEKFF